MLTPAKHINYPPCVRKVPLFGCSMSVPLRAIALQPFIPTATRSELVQKRNVNLQHSLHMAFSINYCTTSFGSRATIYKVFCVIKNRNCHREIDAMTTSRCFLLYEYDRLWPFAHYETSLVTYM